MDQSVIRIIFNGVKVLSWLSVGSILVLKGHYQLLINNIEYDINTVIFVTIILVISTTIISTKKTKKGDSSKSFYESNREKLAVVLSPFSALFYKIIITEMTWREYVINWGPFKLIRKYDKDEIYEYLSKFTGGKGITREELFTIAKESEGSVKKGKMMLDNKVMELASKTASKISNKSGGINGSKSDVYDVLSSCWEYSQPAFKVIVPIIVTVAGVGAVMIATKWVLLSMGLGMPVRMVESLFKSIGFGSNTSVPKELQQLKLTEAQITELQETVTKLAGEIEGNSVSIQVLSATMSALLTYLYEQDLLDAWVQSVGGEKLLPEVVKAFIKGLK